MEDLNLIGERFDELTGIKSILLNNKGKPLPKKERLMVSLTNCAFCNFVEQISNKVNKDESDEVIHIEDQGEEREILNYSSFGFVVKNRWGVLRDEQGVNYLIVSNRDVKGFEDLELEEIDGFIKLILLAYKRLELEKSLIFFNVGIGSGGSMSHLHAQIAYSPRGGSEILKNFKNKSNVIRDLELARKDGLIIEIPSNLVTDFNLEGVKCYIPKVMSKGLEFRIVGESMEANGRAIKLLILALEGLIGEFNYNLTFFPESGICELIPILDYGTIYQRYYEKNLQLESSFEVLVKINKSLTELKY